MKIKDDASKYKDQSIVSVCFVQSIRYTHKHIYVDTHFVLYTQKKSLY